MENLKNKFEEFVYKLKEFLSNLRFPEVKLPKITLPKFKFPKVSLPKFHIQLPKLSLPKLTMPKINFKVLLKPFYFLGVLGTHWQKALIAALVLGGVWYAGFYSGNQKLTTDRIEALINKPGVKMVVVVDGLNVREGAGKTFKSVGKVNKGTEVVVYDRVVSADGEWCRIDKDKFVACRYLK
jgi:uncharacterized protein YgiM (DUF1202 family)